MDNLQKYLPSRQFITIVLLIIAFIGIFFTVKGLVSLIWKNKGIDGQSGLIVESTPTSRIQKDSNDNGIPDWEEYLWGLNPNKTGEKNKEFILSKKKALIASGDIVVEDDSKTITDNDILSRQFLATIVSLQQTGELNDESIASVSEALGKNIEAVPLPDIFNKSMLTLKDDSTLANSSYRDALGDLINQYSDADIGSELTFIIQGLNNKDQSALYAASTVADAYIAFGKDLIKIPVPKSISSIHLEMANNYAKVGQSVKELSNMLSDPLIGMKSIINYKNYSDSLASDFEKLIEILQ